MPYVPATFDRYVEPFLGSGALFLHVQPKKWILNDLNKDLVNVWKQVKDRAEQVIELMKDFGSRFLRMTKTERVAYCRNITYRIPDMEYDVNRATMFLLMKYSAYMGNILRNGKFYFPGLELNTYDKEVYFLSERFYGNLREVSRYLQTSTGAMTNKDYRHVLKKTRAGDFVFLDPPYDEGYDYRFNYNKGESVGDAFLLELLTEVRCLDRKGVRWMMTQADTPTVRKLFAHYNILPLRVFRGYTNTAKTELLLTNYALQRGQTRDDT